VVVNDVFVKLTNVVPGVGGGGGGGAGGTGGGVPGGGGGPPASVAKKLPTPARATKPIGEME